MQQTQKQVEDRQLETTGEQHLPDTSPPTTPTPNNNSQRYTISWTGIDKFVIVKLHKLSIN